MAAVPSILEDPKSWETTLVAGEELVGLSEPDARSCESPRDLDIQKAKGKQKAAIKDNGDPPRKPKIRWRFDATDQDQWEEASRIMTTVLDPRKGSKSIDPVEVVHPLFTLHKISTCLVVNYTGPDIDELGLATVEIELLEYEKPKPAAGVGAGAKGGGANAGEYELALLNHKLNDIDAALRQLDIYRSSLANAEPADVADLDYQIASLKSQRAAILAQMKKPSADGAQQNA